ncbi:unnamed protein product [Enterobius vermicularis]|uniref:CID domain-containing protein n=1 Tax=Enterobius vermicularis TaxID=51028 RepID=A0A0N4UVP7_ENTVE|nr:unnamed protein product [Enterobius vermicularis]
MQYFVNMGLVSLYELKPPISKNKIQEITKAAIRAIKYYKHVVFGVEKFLTKCKPEYKLPGMYCIDSIIRQSQHQYKEKDVFAARFAVNMLQTVVNLMSCKAEDTMKIVRVMNLWIVQKVYDEEIVRPWLEYCRKAHGSRGVTAFLIILYFLFQDNMPHTPPLEAHEEVTEGGISEKETLEIITNMNLDLGGMFTQDPNLLKRLNKIINEKLVERRELDSRRQGNIKVSSSDRAVFRFFTSLVASCTLWFGRLPSNCSEEDIRMSVIDAGEPKRINIIPSRACAYVTMKDRKAAFRVMERLQRGIQVAKRNVKVSQGLKEKFMDYWDSDRGVSQIPHSKLPENLEPLLEGGQLDVETLPSHLSGTVYMPKIRSFLYS